MRYCLTTRDTPFHDADGSHHLMARAACECCVDMSRLSHVEVPNLECTPIEIAGVIWHGDMFMCALDIEEVNDIVAEPS